MYTLSIFTSSRDPILRQVNNVMYIIEYIINRCVKKTLLQFAFPKLTISVIQCTCVHILLGSAYSFITFLDKLF